MGSSPNSTAIIRNRKSTDYVDPSLQPTPAPDLQDELVRNADGVLRRRTKRGRGSTFLTGAMLGDVDKASSTPKLGDY